MAPMIFPIDYHRFHLHANMYFQMKRWSGWVGEPVMRDKMRIASDADWTRAAQQGHVLRAGFDQAASR